MKPLNITRRRPASAHRRGVALVLVVSVVAATSILAYAMLAASSMRSQIDSNAVDAAEALSLADSGASYAMHALRYSEQFRPATADAATWFYPGENGLRLWPDARGTVDIVVTSTGADTRKIRSTATVVRPGWTTGSKHVTEATVTNSYQGIVNAAAFNAAVTLPNNVRISGTVVSKGTVANHTPTVVPAGINVAPLTSEVLLLSETGVASTASGATANDRTYTYKGVTYVAEKAPATIGLLGLTTSRPSLNPCNVWYSDGNVLLSGCSFTGVLVLRGNASLNVSGTCDVTATSGMPALVIAKKIDLKSSTLFAAKLTVNGAVWLGDDIVATTPNRSDAVLKIDGALLWGDTAPLFNLAAAVDITYRGSAVSNVTHLSTVKTVSGLTINSWKAVD